MMKIEEIKIALIKTPAIEMREEVAFEALEELADSITRNGLINPLVVVKKGDGYEIVAGYRRYEACKILGRTEVACRVVDVDDRRLEELKVHENLHREVVNPADEAIYYERLLKEKDFSLDDIVKLTGKGRSYVEGRFEIAKYDPVLIRAIQSGKLPLSCAKELQKFKTPELREQYLIIAINNGATSRTILSWREQWLVENGYYSAPVMEGGGVAGSENGPTLSNICAGCQVDLKGRPMAFLMLCGHCDSSFRSAVSAPVEKKEEVK